MGTPEDAIRAAAAEEASVPGRSEETRDRLTILSGTGQNIGGLAIFVLASFGMNILIARAFGKGSAAFGQITVATQLAFVVGAATRFGMDMAAVRRVAIEVGKGEGGRDRAIVGIALVIASAVSVVVAVGTALAANFIGPRLKVPGAAVRAGAAALIFVALAQVYLGGSRGLKIMRHTLYAYWVGQSIGWIVLTLVLWSLFDRTVAVTVWAYALSWVIATIVAFVSWRHATRGSHAAAGRSGRGLGAHEVRRAARAPRPSSARPCSTPTWPSSSLLRDQDPRVSVYAASIRVAQALVLFLTAVSYMFSPFVADLYERGLRDRLNALFKQITRWTLGGTIPLLLLFMIAPASMLKVFGGSYDAGTSWLRLLLIGQIVNVSVGAAGFVLIMVGRTGWDLLVYALAFLLDLAVAIVLVPHLGPAGAAIAQACALVFSNAVRLWLVWRFVKIQPYDRYYARLLIPAVIGAVVMAAVHSVTGGPHWAVDLVATGSVGGAVYYVAFVFFGLTPQEKTGALNLIRRFTERKRDVAAKVP